MQTPVKCKNCGTKWLRVVCLAGELEMNVDLQPNCPNCGSNWFEPVEEGERDVVEELEKRLVECVSPDEAREAVEKARDDGFAAAVTEMTKARKRLCAKCPQNKVMNRIAPLSRQGPGESPVYCQVFKPCPLVPLTNDGKDCPYFGTPQ